MLASPDRRGPTNATDNSILSPLRGCYESSAAPAHSACVSDAADDPSISPIASKRLKEMLAFTELVDRWYVQMLSVPRPRLVALIKLGEKIVSLLPMGKTK